MRILLGEQSLKLCFNLLAYAFGEAVAEFRQCLPVDHTPQLAVVDAVVTFSFHVQEADINGVIYLYADGVDTGSDQRRSQEGVQPPCLSLVALPVDAFFGDGFLSLQDRLEIAFQGAAEEGIAYVVRTVYRSDRLKETDHPQ